MTKCIKNLNDWYFLDNSILAEVDAEVSDDTSDRSGLSRKEKHYYSIFGDFIVFI